MTDRSIFKKRMPGKSGQSLEFAINGTVEKFKSIREFATKYELPYSTAVYYVNTDPTIKRIED